MKYTIHVGNKPIVLEHENIDSKINVDELTLIDTSNIFGEAVTISAAANRIGLLKAALEEKMSLAKLDLKILEGQIRSRKRREALNPEHKGFFITEVDGESVKVKISEKALESCFETDLKWIEAKKKFIKLEGNFNALSSLHWAIQDKCRKLNGLVNNTTPEEFVAELVEGKINGILVRKG